MGAYPERIELMGAPIDPYTMEESVARANEYIESGLFAHLVGVNADKILQMRDDLAMRSIVERCELVNADGASMLIAAKRLGASIPERVAGIDLMYRLCELAQNRRYSIFLLGAKPHVVKKASDRLEEKYPGIRIVGVHDGYFSEEEYDDVGELINSARPDIVFVGITSPKKELLIERFRSLGLRGVYVGVGGSFDVVSGEIPRAPIWMQRLKLEWLFRMAREPKRLLKRYLIGNARFMHLLHEEAKTANGMR